MVYYFFLTGPELGFVAFSITKSNFFRFENFQIEPSEPNSRIEPNRSIQSV